MPITVREPNAFECVNMAHVRMMLELIGEAMDPEEFYGVMLQLKHLGEDPDYKLADLRFFGKFFGLFNNYYVFEGIPKQRPASIRESETGMCSPCDFASTL
jgi:radial spoke head protein 4/6